MSTDTSRAIRVYASNVKDLYELIDDTYKDLLYCIKIVEDWLYKHGVPIYTYYYLIYGKLYEVLIGG